MSTWNVTGQSNGTCKSWRDLSPELMGEVERIRAPIGRGIVWEGTEIWAYKDRPRNVIEVFDNNVKHYPDNEAYVFYPTGDRYTWSEVGEKVKNAATALKEKYGFKKGDRFCLLSPGCIEYVVGYLAVLKLGGIAVPVNLGLSAEGIATQVKAVEAKGCVVSPEIWHEKLKAIRSHLGSIEVVFVTGLESNPGATTFSAISDAASHHLASADIDEWDLCAISFTSGTTGAPKGTMAMHINALGCARNVSTVVKGLAQTDVNICMPPLYHNTAVYCDFLPALVTAGKCVIMRSFNPLESIKIIEKERATWCVAAPIMLWMIMNHPDFRKHNCTSLKKIVFGGHAASETFINQLAKELSPVAMVNAGSVSESTAVGFALPTEDAIRKITSCGLATQNTEITIFDESGNELTEPGAVGEVAYKGQQTNAGYWRQPEKTNEVFRKDGYVLSGDWAKIDEEGYLFLLDRKKDMIVRGGQNVYCIEVENKLYMHEKVLSAAVVGVPDHVFSERIKAVVVPKPGENLSATEIREHCKRHLARYEIPEYVVIAKSIPTNPAGKTMKPPLVDSWGHSEESEDPNLSRFEAFHSSITEEVRDKAHLNVAGMLYTPNDILKNVREKSELGMVVRQLIEDKGLVEMLKPSEARFQNS